MSESRKSSPQMAVPAGDAGAYDRVTEFRILGPLQVEDRGRELPLGGPAERHLLAVLLCLAIRPVSVSPRQRERIAESIDTVQRLVGPPRIETLSEPGISMTRDEMVAYAADYLGLELPSRR